MRARFFITVLLTIFLLAMTAGCLNKTSEVHEITMEGLAHHTMGRYDEAMAAYDRALAIDPENEEAWQYRGLSLSQLGRQEEAELSFAKALQINPGDQRIWYFQALSRDFAGNTTGALDSVNRAVAIKPKNRDEAIVLTQAWTLKGDLLIKAGRGTEANESYQHAHETMMSTI